MGNLRLHGADGRLLEFSGEPSLIGRDPKSPVLVDDKSVSRKHAIIEKRGEAWAILDQGSANGTFIDGHQITEAELLDGQQLLLGSVEFQVEVESGMPGTVMMQAPAAPPPVPRAPVPRSAPPPVAAPRVGAWAEDPAGPSDAAPSPREEAAAQLGVAVEATAYEVQEAYRDRAAELQQRIAQARTPSLKATYEKNLHALRGARDLLCPELSMESSAIDLPALQPSVMPDAMAHMRTPARATGAAAPATPAAAGQSGGLPGLTLALGSLVIVLLGLTVFFLLSSSKTGKLLTEKETSPDLATLRADAARFRVTEELLSAGALKNGTLQICNASAMPLQVLWLGSAYRDTESPEAQAGQVKIREFNSQGCDLNFKLVIPPGGQVSPRYAECPRDRAKWDGSSIFYGFAVQQPGSQERVWFSGLLQGKQDCVRIGEGWQPAAPPAPAPPPRR